MSNTQGFRASNPETTIPVHLAVRAPAYTMALLGLLSLGCTSEVGDDEDIAEYSQAICSNPVPPPLADISRGWPTGVVRFRFDGSATTAHLDAVRAAMTEWETQTGIVDFVEAPSDDSSAFPIIVEAREGFGACFAGYIPPNCLGAARHELGHLLGLAHEQQRYDRDRFIALIHDDDICNDGSEATKYIDTIWSGTNFGVYNYDSVEHYGPVLGDDDTYDFTRLDGTVDGLGGDDIVTPGDASAVHESRARFFGWDRLRNRGTSVGDGPLVPQLASEVTMPPGSQLAAARIRRIDVLLAFGTNGRVYASSHGTRSSSWREIWTQGSAIAATTVGGELALARATSSGVSVQLSTNAQSLAGTQPSGDSAFMNGISFGSSVNWGLPSGAGTITGLALASLGSTQLAVLARASSGSLWLRTTTNLTSPTGSWFQVTSTTASAPPALVAFTGQLRAYYSTTASDVTTLRQRLCSSTSCQSQTTITNVLDGTSVAATASASELHLVVRSTAGISQWRRYDISGSFTPIGGVVAGQQVVTNSFEDRFGSFGLFAELADGNPWHRVYDKSFKGRLSNLPPNDFDRDGRSDFVIVRDGTWWIRPSSGLPDASFNFGAVGDEFLPAADYSADRVSDITLYRPSNGTWYSLGIDRQQSATGQPISLGTTAAFPAKPFGLSTDQPIRGDFDGDWVMDEAVFRPSNGTWYASLSGGGADMVVQFGAATDRPVPGDYDGDGKTDVAVFRPSNATWYVRPSAGGADIVQTLGAATDRLVPADYDGDGRTDFAYFRPSTGGWTIRFRNGEPDQTVAFGEATDRVVPGDYDGDGRTDQAVFRPRNGTWYVKRSGGGADLVQAWGGPTDVIPSPAHTQTAKNAINDIDRDGKTDQVIVRSGTWWVRKSQGGGHISANFGASTDTFLPAADAGGSGVPELALFRPSNGTWYFRTMERDGSGAALPSIQFGASTDIPVSGDFDGDGILDAAVYRPSNGTWYARRSAGGSDFVQQFGNSTDRPAAADYDGDGRSDVAVFRSSNATFYVRPSGGGSDIVQALGSSTDRVVPADYDGDQRADFAVFTPSTGRWQARMSGGGSNLDLAFGASTDKLVPGDYDGDGRTDVAVFRPSNGTWYARPSTGGSDLVVQFGASTDKLPWPVHVGN